MEFVDAHINVWEKPFGSTNRQQKKALIKNKILAHYKYLENTQISTPDESEQKLNSFVVQSKIPATKCPLGQKEEPREILRKITNHSRINSIATFQKLSNIDTKFPLPSISEKSQNLKKLINYSTKTNLKETPLCGKYNIVHRGKPEMQTSRILQCTSNLKANYKGSSRIIQISNHSVLKKLNNTRSVIKQRKCSGKGRFLERRIETPCIRYGLLTTRNSQAPSLQQYNKRTSRGVDKKVEDLKIPDESNLTQIMNFMNDLKHSIEIVPNTCRGPLPAASDILPEGNQISRINFNNSGAKLDIPSLKITDFEEPEFSHANFTQKPSSIVEYQKSSDAMLGKKKINIQNLQHFEDSQSQAIKNCIHDASLKQDSGEDFDYIRKQLHIQKGEQIQLFCSIKSGANSIQRLKFSICPCIFQHTCSPSR